MWSKIFSTGSLTAVRDSSLCLSHSPITAVHNAGSGRLNISLQKISFLCWNKYNFDCDLYKVIEAWWYKLHGWIYLLMTIIFYQKKIENKLIRYCHWKFTSFCFHCSNWLYLVFQFVWLSCRTIYAELICQPTYETTWRFFFF